MKKKFVSTKTQILNEGRAETLLRLIARRFGPPADDVADRIRAGTAADLDRWTDRILDARTIADVFAR